MVDSNNPEKTDPQPIKPQDALQRAGLRSIGASSSQILKILAIEDNPADFKLLKTYLAGLPFALSSANRLSQGLKILSSENFDAVLLDLSLPDAQGIDTFYQLHCRIPHIPIVVLTGLDDEIIGSEAVQAGAQDYLVKGELPPGLLGRSIKYAVERHQSELKMKELNDSLEKRVAQLAAANHELDQLAQALALSSEQAIQASNFKSQFVARISHDLRTPISGVLGITELLLRPRSSSPEESRRLIELIDEAARSQLSLLNDILDLSKIEAGKVELEIVSFCPVKLLEDITQLFAASAASKEVSLMTYIDTDLPANLVGDSARLREILINLTNNALKFTPQGEIILKAVRESEDGDNVKVRFSVLDTGPGLPEEISKHLFEPFVQSRTGKQLGGTGLGLSICKRLVQLMDGQIGAEAGPGKGACFWFSVWLKKSRELGAENHLFLSHLLASYLPNLKVLIVDDNSTAREIIQRYLQAVGWKAEGTAANAAEAIEMLHHACENNEIYNVAVVDLEKSQPDSFELAQLIRQEARFADLPLIFITDFDQRRKGELAWEAGYSAYLTKPIRQCLLLDCIAELAIDASNKSPQTILPDQLGNEAADQEEPDKEIRVLVAEDNELSRTALVKQLEDLGALVDAVSNGQEAVAAVSRTKYSLVLMDCDMPVMGGLEATRLIRKLFGIKPPIVATTTSDDKADCRQAGMNDYLSKPISSEQLCELMARWAFDQETI